jgi:predicted  nucleic acid-binding Zn-ribbon protein
LAENLKYAFFMDEIVALEKEVHIFLQKHEMLKKEYSDLEKKFEEKTKENELLKLKNKELDEKLKDVAFQGTNLFNSDSLDTENKEEIKQKISELISKLDYHLRS